MRRFNSCAHYNNPVTRVLELFGQQVNAQRESGIMELNQYLHNNRRQTGRLPFTLFIIYYEKKSSFFHGEYD